jgi:polyhydroxyalkanoate synthesis regulator protein
MKTALKSQSVLIRRYARSRLYDTISRRYVSLAQLRAWAAEGLPFSVIDAEDGADITRILLA